MKQPINVPARPVEPPPAGFSVADVYYIFFRHKWKILTIFLLGLATASGFFFLTPAVYESEAKIFIKYVLDATTPVPVAGGGNEPKVKSPDSMGKNIINSEVEMLTSFDLAGLVAELIGPEKILAKVGGGTNRSHAAMVIMNGLKVQVPENSSVLRIAFSHPDSTVVQPVLNELVNTYLNRHVQIHQGVGILDEVFSRQADQSRARLSEIEDELKKVRAGSGVISLEDNRQALLTEQARIEKELSSAVAEHAEQTAMLATWEKMRPGQSTVVTNTGVPADIASRYRMVTAELDSFQKRRMDLQFKFTEEHPQVKRLTQEIARAEGEKRDLEQQYTNLVSLTPPPSSAASSAEVDLTAQVLRVSALEAKIGVLTNQLSQVRSNFVRVVEVAPAITKLERQRSVEEAKLNFYSSNLERARNDEAFGAGKITNVNSIQKPTPPARDTKALKKPLAVTIAFGLFGGFAWAFLIERVLNQRVRRLADLERLVPAPVFVSVPDFSWKGTRPTRQLRNGSLELTNGDGAPAVNGHAHPPAGANGSAVAPVDASASAPVAPWDSRHILRSYYEGLRDRLITYFEVRNLTHKPKLVAVTSCKHGAGVTTMAAGLAATLSETGDGNVLLVDMNLEQGAAHQFYQGKPGCALSDALENATREPAQVQENLYLVSAHETRNDKLPRALPKRFAHLIPRMKASDYDYIIFDMPPITQTSVTPRLAGLMDMVLVVVESETTGQEVVKRAHGLLEESRATVATVLNKHRAYIPERLSQEL